MPILCRCLPALLVLAASCPTSAATPKAYYQLGGRSQEFTRALVDGDAGQIYRMFVPQFRKEISFTRFDSALSVWYGDRRIRRAREKIVHVDGLAGHVSTWPVFDGAADYSYVYQNWFYAGRTWQLVWLSNILDQSFQYGQADTAAVIAVAEAALRHLTTPDGLASVHPGLQLPDTVVAVWRLEPTGTDISVPGHPVVLLSPDEAGDDGPVLRVPYYFRFAAIRVLGDFATCAIDVVPTPPNEFGILRRTQGVLIYLENRDGRWLFHSSKN